jgi:hypothetical protein
VFSGGLLEEENGEGSDGGGIFVVGEEGESCDKEEGAKSEKKENKI